MRNILKGLIGMLHIWGHFCTVSKHKYLVFLHCVRAGIPIQGIFHDMSKFSPTEFLEGARFYLGSRSPTEREREVYGYSKAWMHHKGRNKHHYEYWSDVPPGKHAYEPVPMPTRYLVESVMDRIAASKVYRGKDYADGDALAYLYREHASELLHPDTYRKMEFLLTLLRDRGEAYLFSFLRQVVLKNVAFEKWADRATGDK